MKTTGQLPEKIEIIREYMALDLFFLEDPYRYTSLLQLQVGPYFANQVNPSRPGTLPLVEVPVSIGLTRQVPKRLLRAYVRIPKVTRVRGLLSRDYLGLLDFAWLYPPRFELETMQPVARTLVSEGNPVLNIFLHSSELVVGQSKWVRNDEELDRCLGRLRALLSFCVEELGARPVTLTESGRELAPRLRAGECWHSNGDS